MRKLADHILGCFNWSLMFSRNAQDSVHEEALLDGVFDELFPLLRSITGEGYRTSLEILARHLPLEVERVATGTNVFDWTVPEEWVYRSAKLMGPDGEVIVDADRLNLHVLNYSMPIDARMTLEELLPHLHTLPNIPDEVPYVTSYYKRQWGFCMSQRQLDSLPAEGEYHAIIDTEFIQGSIDIGQCILPGESDREILLTSYLCHPSLANNELSGPLVLLALYRRLASWKRRRYTYRFVLNPETIGSLCFLHLHGKHLTESMVGGLVVTCVGGPSTNLSFKASRDPTSLIDRVVSHRAALLPDRVQIRPFTPLSGSDERQYGSPGFKLPMAQVARTIYGEYEGYHNSLDSKEFMGIQSLVRSADEIEDVLREVEIAGWFRNLAPYGEPQLGKRDLYPNVNSAATWRDSSDMRLDGRRVLEQVLTLLCYSDGQTSVIEISEMMGCHPSDLAGTIERLEKSGLLEHIPEGRIQ